MGGKPGPGRPPGSRNRLAEDFQADVCADWKKHGTAVIAKVRNKNPTAYLRVVASVVGRELPPPLAYGEYSSLSDEELADALAETAAAMKHAIKQSGAKAD